MPAFNSRATAAWPEWPEYALAVDLLASIRTFAEAGAVALATLVSVVKSSPRPLGSEMVVAADGRVAGYVSGGCVEAAVAAEALAVLADGRPRMLDYGVGSPVIDIQLTCGGRIGIFVRTLLDPGLYVAAIEAAHRKRRAITVLTDRVDGSWSTAKGIQAGDGRRYACTHEPRLRLVIVGADPVTLALARLAAEVGIEVALIRPYGPSSLPPDVPLASYDNRSLHIALGALVVDGWTAIYSLSHDTETDHAVAMHALHSPAFAVGVLGSRNKATARVARLRSEGLTDGDLVRFHLPAGIFTGARSPQAIALSILAEVFVADAARRAPG
jgi:xanthine dehydrogenase accessory factor